MASWIFGVTDCASKKIRECLSLASYGLLVRERTSIGMKGGTHQIGANHFCCQSSRSANINFDLPKSGESGKFVVASQKHWANLFKQNRLQNRSGKEIAPAIRLDVCCILKALASTREAVPAVGLIRGGHHQALGL